MSEMQAPEDGTGEARPDITDSGGCRPVTGSALTLMTCNPY
jgi:hypothetical protein